MGRRGLWQARSIDGRKQVEWECIYGSDDGIACNGVLRWFASCYQLSDKVGSSVSQSVFLFSFQVVVQLSSGDDQELLLKR